MASVTPKDTLDALFPLPTVSGSGLSPTPGPGVSSDAGKTLSKLLKDNHERFHIFFNDRGFHNHTSHHLFAIYNIGATPEVLESAYQSNAGYQKPSFDSPGEVTEANWKEHLGDEKYYRAYLKFFSAAALDKGIQATLEKYFFSTSANWVEPLDGNSEKQPQMLNRLLSGVLHPLIHAGYACEFGSPGMLAEGLSMACVTRVTDMDVLVPMGLFVTPSTPGGGTSTIGRLMSSLSLTSPPPTSIAMKSSHTFSIIARMQADPELAPGVACKPAARMGGGPGEDHDADEPFRDTLKNKGELIRKYAEEWTVDTTNKAEVESKIEELSWLMVLLYGVTGLQEGKDFKADFFTMHLVTSSLFLPSYLAHLTPSSQSLLLRTYLSSALAVWVSRGRPGVHIASFYKRSSPIVSPPGPSPKPGDDALSKDQLYPNAFFPVLQSTLLHPNEHLPKAQRSLAHYAARYGTADKGRWSGTELEDAELLDGTLFARVAGLTMNALKWVREGEGKGEWDFAGFWA